MLRFLLFLLPLFFQQQGFVILTGKSGEATLGNGSDFEIPVNLGDVWHNFFPSGEVPLTLPTFLAIAKLLKGFNCNMGASTRMTSGQNSCTQSVLPPLPELQ